MEAPEKVFLIRYVRLVGGALGGWRLVDRRFEYGAQTTRVGRRRCPKGTRARGFLPRANGRPPRLRVLPAGYAVRDAEPEPPLWIVPRKCVSGVHEPRLERGSNRQRPRETKTDASTELESERRT